MVNAIGIQENYIRLSVILYYSQVFPLDAMYLSIWEDSMSSSEKYPVGSEWEMKKTKVSDKGDRVVIIDNGEPGKNRVVAVQDKKTLRNYVVSVKQFWRRVK